MNKEKAARAISPNGLVEVDNFAPVFYQAPHRKSNDIYPFVPIAIGAELAIAKVSAAYALSRAVALVVVEQSGLGGRSR